VRHEAISCRTAIPASYTSPIGPRKATAFRSLPELPKIPLVVYFLPTESEVRISLNPPVMRNTVSLFTPKRHMLSSYLKSSKIEQSLLFIGWKVFQPIISARPLRGITHRTAVLSLGWRLRLAASYLARQPLTSATKGTLIQCLPFYSTHTYHISSKAVTTQHPIPHSGK